MAGVPLKYDIRAVNRGVEEELRKLYYRPTWTRRALLILIAIQLATIILQLLALSR